MSTRRGSFIDLKTPDDVIFELQQKIIKLELELKNKKSKNKYCCFS